MTVDHEAPRRQRRCRGARRRPRPTAPRRHARRRVPRAPRPARRAGVPRVCTSTTTRRWRSAGSSARWSGSVGATTRRDLPGDPRPGEEPGRRLPQGHVRLAHRRHDRRHPDHGHRAERARRSRPSGGDTEFASTYAAYEDLTDDEQEQALDTRVVHSFHAAQQLVDPDPSEAELECGGKRPAEDAPAGVAARVGRESLVLGATDRPRRGDGPRTRVVRYLADLLDRSTVARAGVPARVGGRRPRDLGQPRRAAPGHALRRVVGTRHAPHDHRRRRGGPVSERREPVCRASRRCRPTSGATT